VPGKIPALRVLSVLSRVASLQVRRVRQLGRLLVNGRLAGIDDLLSDLSCRIWPFFQIKAARRGQHLRLVFALEGPACGCPPPGTDPGLPPPKAVRSRDYHAGLRTGNPRYRPHVPWVVQQRQYRVPTRITVFFTVIGAFVAFAGMLVVPAGALQHGGMSLVVVGSVLILAGALFIALALRPGKVTVDDRGLHLHTITRARVIPWSLVRSFEEQPFQQQPGGGGLWSGLWSVWVELDSGNWSALPGTQGSRGRAERIVAELMAARREHLVDGGS
jgi:hypothetical protein